MELCETQDNEVKLFLGSLSLGDAIPCDLMCDRYSEAHLDRNAYIRDDVGKLVLWHCHSIVMSKCIHS